MRNAPPLRQAAVLHRLAWCARERGDMQAERSWLSQALQAYGMAYNHFDDREGPKTVLRVAYLCGELNTRLGDLRAAAHWFSEGLRHPVIKQYPHWERMLREQWSTVRAFKVDAAWERGRKARRVESPVPAWQWRSQAQNV